MMNEIKTDKLLDLNTVINLLQYKYNKYFGKSINSFSNFNDAILNLQKQALDNKVYSQFAENLFKFCVFKSKDPNNPPLIKISRQIVPFDILNSVTTTTTTTILYDIKVNNKNNPDDKIYLDNPSIQKHIPRGLCFLKTTSIINDDDDDDDDIVIYSNKKFTGETLIDEDEKIKNNDDDDDDDNDDDNNDQYKYFLKKDCKYIIEMEKINGDAVHFSARYINNKFYLIIGSKNNHMLLGKKSDISYYEEGRYEMAKIFANALFEELDKLEEDNREILYSFLHHTRTTALCEIIRRDYQHIVPIPNDLKNKSRVVFITLTSPGIYPVNAQSLTSFHPQVLSEIMKCLGLYTAECQCHPVENMDVLKNKIRYELDQEGKVLYCLDDKYNTIGLLKVKTFQYICLRALREKAIYICNPKRKKHISESKINDLIEKRYFEIQKWLKLPTLYTNFWQDIGIKFINWINTECVDFKLIRPQFPAIWNKYVVENKIHGLMIAVHNDFTQYLEMMEELYKKYKKV